MRFALLGSGSRGNATLIESGSTRLLVDCGFSVKETERRLGRLGLEAGSLSAILVTHEHNDHITGVGALARKYRLPVWLTPGTHSRGKTGEVPVQHFLNCHADFAIGDIGIHPFPVPHDAREPCQFVFNDGSRRLGLLTDTGRSTPHIEEQLGSCDALILECNHDAQMLMDGPYPPSLKQRVGGGLGHLSNAQAAALLAGIEAGALQHIVAAHLSEQNNRPELAAAALSGALNCQHDWIALADQELGLDWRQIS